MRRTRSESTDDFSYPAEPSAGVERPAPPSAADSGETPRADAITEATVRDQLRSWIAERAHLSSAKELNDQTQILEQGLISSLDVVELMLFIESILEREIDADDIEPDVFQSIDRLYEHFFSKGND